MILGFIDHEGGRHEWTGVARCQLPDRVIPYAILGTTKLLRTMQLRVNGVVTELWERHRGNEIEHRFTLRFPESELPSA